MTETTVWAHCLLERAAMSCGRGQTTDESEAPTLLGPKTAALLFSKQDFS